MFGRKRNTNATRRLKYDIENNTQYNRLKIIKYDHYKKIGYTFKDYVVCDCSCGNKNIVKEYQGILSGMIKSCGCLNNETRIIVGKNNKRYNTYDLTGEYGIGYTSKGEEFWFDLEDYDKIKDYCWSADSKRKNYKAIVARDCENNKVIRLCNLIMDSKNIDHINRNTFDNRKSNLRICTQSQNSKNQSKPKNSQCEFMGVSYERGAYRARIGYNHKKINLGSYKNLEDAIVARLRAEKEYFGEFAPQRNLFEKYGI